MRPDGRGHWARRAAPPATTTDSPDPRTDRNAKIIHSTYISLDGVIENPHLWPPSGDDAGESDAIQTELLLGCDAVRMG
jgi:hypothetical protein